MGEVYVTKDPEPSEKKNITEFYIIIDDQDYIFLSTDINYYYYVSETKKNYDYEK